MSDASPAEDWAGYLRRMTRRAGWSVQRLADESGVHRSRLFKYMAGDSGVTIDTIRRIATALGDNPENALRAAAQIGAPESPADAQDEEVALIMRAPVDDDLRQVMLRKLYERRERDRQRRMEDFQEMIDLANRGEG